MPIWILKYWKWIGMGALLLGAFVMGQRWEAAAYEKERADTAQAVVQAIQLREAEIRSQHLIQVEADAEARTTLQSDLAAIRQREQELMTRVHDLSLVKPIPEIRIEGCFENEDTTVVIGNPFTLDFVSLWNDTSRHATTQ